MGGDPGGWKIETERKAHPATIVVYAEASRPLAGGPPLS
jgi:hypothetical protein